MYAEGDTIILLIVAQIRIIYIDSTCPCFLFGLGLGDDFNLIISGWRLALTRLSLPYFCSHPDESRQLLPLVVVCHRVVWYGIFSFIHLENMQLWAWFLLQFHIWTQLRFCHQTVFNYITNGIQMQMRVAQLLNILWSNQGKMGGIRDGERWYPERAKTRESTSIWHRCG